MRVDIARRISLGQARRDIRAEERKVGSSCLYATVKALLYTLCSTQAIVCCVG